MHGTGEQLRKPQKHWDPLWFCASKPASKVPRTAVNHVDANTDTLSCHCPPPSPDTSKELKILKKLAAAKTKSPGKKKALLKAGQAVPL